jgi:hypothetical protein
MARYFAVLLVTSGIVSALVHPLPNLTDMSGGRRCGGLCVEIEHQRNPPPRVATVTIGSSEGRIKRTKREKGLLSCDRYITGK